jgi:hypothetical protein
MRKGLGLKTVGRKEFPAEELQIKNDGIARITCVIAEVTCSFAQFTIVTKC